jgi:hypothetical protein
VHSRGHRATRNKELVARPLMAGRRLCDRRQHGLPRTRRGGGLVKAVVPWGGGHPVVYRVTVWRKGGARSDGQWQPRDDATRVRRRRGWVVGVAWRAGTRGTRGVGEKGGGMAVPQRADQQIKDRPRRADPADRGAATTTPARARALWSTRVPTQFSLTLFRRVFLKIFELKWTNI